jgi:anti-anti-sigma factor
MEIQISPFKNWQIVAIEGKLIFKYLSQVEKALNALEKSCHYHVAIDLTFTTNMDSSAITLIVKYFKRIRQKNGQLVFFGANKDITEIIDIVGLANTVPFFKTRQQFEDRQLLN